MKMDLKEIEKRYARGYNLNTDSGWIQWQNDMEWLMEQDEKVKQLEEELQQYRIQYALLEKVISGAYVMNTKDYKEIPYTIEIDWESGTMWFNNHVSQEKMILTEKDSKSILQGFRLIQARKNGMF